MADTPSPHWYEEFYRADYFAAYGPTLTEERTGEEVAFVERVLDLRPGDEILDLCCGYGRIAVPLAQHGLRVTGLDLNPALLDELRERAAAAAIEIDTVHADMREIPFEARFDAVIDIFSSYGYLDSDEEDQQVLTRACRALKPGGRFLVDVINREWIVANYVQHDWHQADDGTYFIEDRELDLLTSRNHVNFTIVSPEGEVRRSAGLHMRLYTLTETVRMLERAGLTFTGVSGAFDGVPYGVHTPRMIVTARKG